MTSDDIKAAAERAGDKASDSAHDLKESLRSAGSRTMKQAKDMSGQLSDAAGSLYGRAADQMQGLSDQLPNSASDAYRTGQQMYSQGSKTVARQVSKQPIEALLLAGAIGYLVGWATSRS